MENPFEETKQEVDSFIELKEIIKNQTECLEQCAKVFDPNSPIGIQIRLTLDKSKSL